MTCSKEKRPILIGTKHNSNKVYMYQPRCKTWGCEYCANLNRIAWLNKIRHGLQMYRDKGIDDWSFLTITAMGYCDTADKCLYAWKKAWPKLSARIRRKFGTVCYVRVVELHKDGRLHWHMVISTEISKRWAKDNAYACGLGYMTDSRKVSSDEGLVFYISKYLSKSVGQSGYPKRVRRIVTSQKWPDAPEDEGVKESDIDWEYHTTYYAEGLAYIAYRYEQENDCPVVII